MTVVSDPLISVALAGNSMVYFNDCPRILEHMLHQQHPNVEQDSCLRGGASLRSLFVEGNGMRNKFTSLLEEVPIDIGSPTVADLLTKRPRTHVVLQDQTQGPVRAESRTESLESLRNDYAPLLLQQQQRQEEANPTAVLLLQTFAYKVPGMRGTEDLGDFSQYTQLLVDGCAQYRDQMQTELPKNCICRVVPMAVAVHHVHRHHRSLWEKLYSWDDFHPSPHATYLQACLLCLAIGATAKTRIQSSTSTSLSVPPYDPTMWNKCRYLQPPVPTESLPQQPSTLPFPTKEEAETLARVACLIHDEEQSRWKATD